MPLEVLAPKASRACKCAPHLAGRTGAGAAAGYRLGGWVGWVGSAVGGAFGAGRAIYNTWGQ